MVDGSRGFRPKQTCHTLESKRSEEDKQLIDMSSCARQTRKIWGSGVPRSMWKRWSIGPSFPSNLQLGDSVIMIFISTKSSKLYTALYIYIYLFLIFEYTSVLHHSSSIFILHLHPNQAITLISALHSQWFHSHLDRLPRSVQSVPCSLLHSRNFLQGGPRVLEPRCLPGRGSGGLVGSAG